MKNNTNNNISLQNRRIKIAYFLPKLNYSAQIIYVYNLVNQLYNDFDITIFYFDSVIEISCLRLPGFDFG